MKIRTQNYKQINPVNQTELVALVFLISHLLYFVSMSEIPAFQLLARGKQEQFKREDNQLKLKFKSAYQDLCFISAAGKALSLGVATFIVVQTTRVRPEQYVQKNRVDAFRQQLSKGSIERTEYTPTNIVLNTLESSERSIEDG